MRKTFRYYIDDSGSPNPDHEFEPQNHALNWFALGGIVIDEANTNLAEDRIMEFRRAWPQLGGSPLHSYKIRNKQESFRWLADAGDDAKRFMADLSSLMMELPYYALACVVHRPGYNERYRGMYGDGRWSMCKTAFNIGVDRAAKYARMNGARLRVYVEHSNKDVNAKIKGYYEGLMREGLPFNQGSSAKYGPLTAEEFKSTLVEFQTKPKDTKLMQIADLALWPVCQGGYNPGHRAYREMQENGKLLDSLCGEGGPLYGVKYSCFEAADPEKQKPPA